MAIGGEFAHYGLEMNRNRPNNTGPSSRGSEAFYLFLKRNVKSAYAELNIPLVGAGQRDALHPPLRHQPVGPRRRLQRDRHDHQSARCAGLGTDPRHPLPRQLFPLLRRTTAHQRRRRNPQRPDQLFGLWRVEPVADQHPGLTLPAGRLGARRHLLGRLLHACRARSTASPSMAARPIPSRAAASAGRSASTSRRPGCRVSVPASPCSTPS